MDKRIIRMYRTDCLVVLIFMALTWATLIYVLREVLHLTDSQPLKVLMVLSSVAAGTFATAALLAVLWQLRRNRDEIYSEDISHLSAGREGTGHE